MTRKPFVAGNWKMNGLRADGVALALDVARGAPESGVEVVLCPPATLLHPIMDALKAEGLEGRVGLGAQDCHFEAKGAFTGDISVSMIKDAGCTHVIVGHSERRTDHEESDDIVRSKAEAVHAAGLTAIICIGETLQQRESGMTMATISSQLDLSVPAGATAENTVIAYEPVWAIGTGMAATPDDAQDVHDHIRTYLTTSHGQSMPEGLRILYGGSVKPDNASVLFTQADIDGGLIGGASLKSEDFLGIVEAAIAG